ncbi:hypothetical protein LQT97_09900 [Brucella pseudogrignonensis]|uniref:DUF7940 domain-containing protein n=1 Tax=Brucella pseudogrignonensis TaxID=419475 RepID=UPI001E3ADBAD|nr:hypothetical protein [Brucella pseudogrignonensis]MCD4511551.1 hypothetical protein [Brucella pseudogrignonensis]
MQLVPDWRHVLRKAWSVRLILLAGLLTGIEVALPLLGDAYPIPTGLFAILSLVVTMAAFVMRLVSQKVFRDGE